MREVEKEIKMRIEETTILEKMARKEKKGERAVGYYNGKIDGMITALGIIKEYGGK